MTQTPFTAEFPWPAPAKLNLFLHVTGRRADGYHTLQTVFQFLDHGDSLFFTPRGDGVIRRSDGPQDIPEAQDLVVRAAQALKAASGCNLGADIAVTKRIPIGGGLGGGSSDAATTLVALNRLWNLGFPLDELAGIGLRLGADVPVFVRGLAAWAEGVGEHLRPLALPEPWYLVLTPPVQVNTADIFNAPELPRATAPITPEDFLAGAGGNDCEAVTCARHPQVREALAWLRRHGPARMSGTGASVFLPLASRAEARALQAQVPASWHSFVAAGLNRSPLQNLSRQDARSNVTAPEQSV
ncbi:MAG: 4-(cytidine 5'-diphospho)-2-C-methyl-D-erythritol kinase [Nevskiaceae bacterium]|nr:MAG: 4-(cytidine 5'-diphospho)-2-C-methyl-D-erythritol kinase [Nevskiaceae bacterium]